MDSFDSFLRVPRFEFCKTMGKWPSQVVRDLRNDVFVKLGHDYPMFKSYILCKRLAANKMAIDIHLIGYALASKNFTILLSDGVIAPPATTPSGAPVLDHIENLESQLTHFSEYYFHMQSLQAARLDKQEQTIELLLKEVKNLTAAVSQLTMQSSSLQKTPAPLTKTLASVTTSSMLAKPSPANNSAPSTSRSQAKRVHAQITEQNESAQSAAKKQSAVSRPPAQMSSGQRLLKFDFTNPDAPGSEIGDENDGYTTVGKKKSKSKSLMVGAGQPSQADDFKSSADDRIFHVYMGRVNIKFDGDFVEQQLAKRGIIYSSFEKISTKHGRFNSFAFDIKHSEKAKLFDPKIWPVGLVLDKYVARYIKEHQERLKKKAGSTASFDNSTSMITESSTNPSSQHGQQ